MAELCALVATFVITVVIGGPIAARLARIQVFRQPTLADPRSPRPKLREAYFEPLDFGPDTMQWPSEVERPNMARPLPPWPSATWDDPHFGKNAPRSATTPVRAERRAAPTSAQAPEPPAPEQAQARQQRSNKKQQKQAQKARQQAQKAQQAQQQAQKAQQAQQQAQKAQQAQQQAQQSRRPQQPQQPRQPSPSAPQAGPPAASSETSDAIERLVAERGLAGAVQFLMQQNGWDFRTAAAFLANNRKR